MKNITIPLKDFLPNSTKKEREFINQEKKIGSAA